MKTISISELRARTSYYVSLAAAEPLTVTDRGKSIAILESAAKAKSTGNPFPKRDRSTIPTSSLDSSALMSKNATVNRDKPNIQQS
ncbi:MAG: type II toxin-antitoxin system Phd/YefM family antitoxin [Opitutaceae bacterium]|jgi:antitoxin (DNA-binding transcriptional repressor) of toxin-antitoxin stability system